MDYAGLDQAVQRLMVDVMRELRAIKSDILIEFRQRYIGPAMREFGNMFRVGDCPENASTNRVGVVDLRLTSGHTASAFGYAGVERKRTAGGCRAADAERALRYPAAFRAAGSGAAGTGGGHSLLGEFHG